METFVLRDRSNAGKNIELILISFHLIDFYIYIFIYCIYNFQIYI
jgi:hypothetical protein